MKKHTLSILAISASVFAHAGTYQLTFNQLGPQPLTPLFYAASNSNFNIFTLGGTASIGIKNISESGYYPYMLGIAAADANVAAYGTSVGGTTTTFVTDSAHPYFSFASMLGRTNDGWIGESVTSMPIDLTNGFSLTVLGSRVWDAGTEKNTQNAADLPFRGGTGNPAEDAGQNHIRVHSGIMSGVGDSWQLQPAWTASTVFARIEVRPVPELSGTVTLNGYLGTLPGSETVPLTFKYLDSTGTSLLATQTVSVTPTNGAATFHVVAPVNLPTSVTLQVDGPTWLAKKTALNLSPIVLNGVDFNLINGDVVKDGVIDLSDYTSVVVAFNALPSSGNWNLSADLNKDGVIDLTDYTSIVTNFNAVGQ